jgi:glycosyltransferase involved in cell wall biosynthesis
MTNKITLSIAIATFNEETNIKRCLDSITNLADEIVIVDGQSSDNTVIIAKKFPNVKIISTPNKPNFHLNKQMAIDACRSDWILQLDADEVVTSELEREIAKIIDSDPPENGFWINRKNYFLGKFLTKGGIYPDSTIRLYRRDKGKLPCQNVHEQAQIDGNIGHLKTDLLHYSDPTFSRYLLRNDRYTSLIASELADNHIKINFFNFLNYFLFKPVHWFLFAFFFHRGYVDGFPGFVFAWYSSLRFPIAYIKLFELSHDSKT